MMSIPTEHSRKYAKPVLYESEGHRLHDQYHGTILGIHVQNNSRTGGWKRLTYLQQAKWRVLAQQFGGSYEKAEK